MARSLLDVATVLAKLDHLVDPGQVSIDLTAGQLSIRAYDPAVSTAILTALDDVQMVRRYEPQLIAAWDGVIPGAHVVVRLILARSARKAAA
jgi:hypothetical protein